MSHLYIGTAGWSLPRADQPRFAGAGSHLERYAKCFRAAEINSSFHRPHRPATYERWAAAVPATFRFSVKIPKIITHERRLRDVAEPLDEFMTQVAGLGEKLGCLLVQTPPSLAFHAASAAQFFTLLRDRTGAMIACEPRHASWFETGAEEVLSAYQVARVAADPARIPEASEPAGWRGFTYYRLHGSPKIYYSSYAREFLATLAGRIRNDQTAGRAVWCIFDNTTLGAATGNALALNDQLRSPG